MTSVNIIERNGKQIIEIKINEGDKKPYYLKEKGLRKEGVFVRKGPSIVPITDDALYIMIQDIRSSSFENYLSFEQNLTFEYAEKYFEKRGIALNKKHMDMLHMRKDEKYTNLAFLLSDQFDRPIKIVAFDDEYKQKFLDRAILEGCVLKQFDESIIFIMRHNRLLSAINGLYRTDMYAFPIKAVREAVMNAIVHRDYTNCGTILISIMPNRMTVISPGGPIIPYTAEEMFSGVSSLRNNGLASIFYRLELIEAFGTGIPRIGSVCSGSGHLPKIEFSPMLFRITLPAIDIKPQSKLNKIIDNRNEYRVRISKTHSIYRKAKRI